MNIGFFQAHFLAQLLVLIRNKNLVAIIAKIFDDLLLAGSPSVTDPIIFTIAAKVKLWTIVHGPGQLLYFVLNLHQNEDLSTVVDGDEMLAKIYSMPFSLLRRRYIDTALTIIEAKAFASVNWTVAWAGISVFPFCATFASLHQEAAPAATVHDFCDQAADLRYIQTLGYTISFTRPLCNAVHALSVTVFTEAGRSASNGQLCYVLGCYSASFA